MLSSEIPHLLRNIFYSEFNAYVNDLMNEALMEIQQRWNLLREYTNDYISLSMVLHNIKNEAFDGTLAKQFLHLTDFAINQGDFDSATSALKALVQEGSYKSEAYLRLARIYYKQACSSDSTASAEKSYKTAAMAYKQIEKK